MVNRGNTRHMLNGYAGRILVVKLQMGKIFQQEINSEFCKNYIGGKGFAVKILLERTEASMDPLSQDSILIFAVGPMNASLVPGSNRLGAFFKSPLTGIWGESYCGGQIATQFKQAGFDVMVISGKSEKPVYILIDDGTVSIKDAAHLWGKDSFETQDTIIADYGKEYQVAAIGPAGENLVKFACIDHSKGRQFGRCGAGALMGSKNLKAIAVRGTKKYEPANIKLVEEVRKKVLTEVKEKHKTLSTYGTPGLLPLINEAGALPTYYWSEKPIEEYEKISPELLKSNYYKHRRSCYGCSIACCQTSETQDELHIKSEGPEYETLYAFGPLCGIFDLDSIIKLGDMCDKLGMDVISAGNTVAFAVECYRRGILGKEDFEGIEPKFGDPKLAVDLIFKIAYRRGLGNILAEGVRKGAQLIGRRAEEFAVHVKGLEPPGYDPRALKGMALAYAVSSRGACHLRHMAYRPNLTGKHPFRPDIRVNRFSYEEQPPMVKEQEDFYTLVDSMIYCHFLCLPVAGPILWDEMLRAFNGVTGFNMEMTTFVECAVRINDLVRIYNLREGVPPDTEFPVVWVSQKLKRRGADGELVEAKKLSQMLTEYYKLRGWSLQGKPRDIS
ncbi:MAG: aldehyde ferredoxin oxidoreductase family protein [Nitrososphaeria archaeon]